MVFDKRGSLGEAAEMVLQAEGRAQTEAARRARRDRAGPCRGRGSGGGQVRQGAQQEMAMKGKAGSGHMGPWRPGWEPD